MNKVSFTVLGKRALIILAEGSLWEGQAHRRLILDKTQTPVSSTNAGLVDKMSQDETAQSRHNVERRTDLYATSLLHRFTTARQRETCARQLSHAGGSAARQRETARDSARQRETAARQPRDSRESYVNLCNKLVAYRSARGALLLSISFAA